MVQVRQCRVRSDGPTYLGALKYGGKSGCVVGGRQSREIEVRRVKAWLLQP